MHPGVSEYDTRAHTVYGGNGTANEHESSVNGRQMLEMSGTNGVAPACGRGPADAPRGLGPETVRPL